MASRNRGWIVGSVLLLTAISALIFWGTMHTVSEIPDRVAEHSSEKVFQTSDGLASITSPGFGWKILPMPVRDATLTIGNHESEEYLAVIAQPKKDFADGFTIRNYAAAANKSITTSLEQAQHSELSDFELNGLNASRNQVSGKFGSAQTEYLNTYIEGDRHFYQIRTWTTRSKRGVAIPRLKLATSTFHELAGQLSE